MNAIDDRIEVHIESFNVDEQNKVKYLFKGKKKHHANQIFSPINKKTKYALYWISIFNFQSPLVYCFRSDKIQL